jgi:NADPH:quinone reductase-like Zn-dependent oxidoreductase
MKAVVQIGYGQPADVLRVDDVDAPAMGERDVLVRVEAASVNALDWHTTRGIPKVIRLTDGRPAPRKRIRGVDLSGVVDAVGTGVTAFKAGDRVFGGADGSFAELAVTTADRLAATPPAVPDEQAATLCVAGLTALQAVRDKARVAAGHRVLVYGAGGGVGVFAVQLTKWLGADVTAATRTAHLDLVRSSGADAVVDYTRHNFARDGIRYDALVVVGGSRSLADCLRVLKPAGRLVIVGGPTDRLAGLLSRIVGGIALSPFTGKGVSAFVAKNDAGDLALLGQLVQEGRLRPIVARRYRLDQAIDAIGTVGSGAVGGKLVITRR